jgi:hypothetical protein
MKEQNGVKREQQKPGQSQLGLGWQTCNPGDKIESTPINSSNL